MKTVRDTIRQECLDVYGFLLMLGNTHFSKEVNAEDVASQAFVNVWANAEVYSRSISNGFYNEESKPWLFSNFLSARRDFLRQDVKFQRSYGDLEQRSDNPLQTIESPQDQVIQNEQLAHLDKAIAQLPETHRAALSLVYQEGLSYYEASQNLKIPESIFRMRVHRAKQSLRRSLSHLCI
jgi:RNA polymerase sigma-70 factor, ECF subfamily